ncbi:hypothetical protein AgCh_017012 [Apium graveolens]
MVDDLLKKQREITSNPHLILNKKQQQFYALAASSGIAATLIPGVRTAHSRFKIPIVLDEHSMCSISRTSDISELIKRTNLIIWDKAPIQHQYSFECVDRSLRDIMKGKIAKVFKPQHNMMLNRGNSLEEVQALRAFAAWVLDLGDGKMGTPNGRTDGEGADDIFVPESFCHLDSEIIIEIMMEIEALDDSMDEWRLRVRAQAIWKDVVGVIQDVQPISVYVKETSEKLHVALTISDGRYQDPDFYVMYIYDDDEDMAEILNMKFNDIQKLNEHYIQINQKAAESLVDPEEYPNLFEDCQLTFGVESKVTVTRVMVDLE